MFMKEFIILRPLVHEHEMALSLDDLSVIATPAYVFSFVILIGQPLFPSKNILTSWFSTVPFGLNVDDTTLKRVEY
jgi:hypothetical protein